MYPALGKWNFSQHFPRSSNGLRCSLDWGRSPPVQINTMQGLHNCGVNRNRDCFQSNVIASLGKQNRLSDKDTKLEPQSSCSWYFWFLVRLDHKSKLWIENSFSTKMLKALKRCLNICLVCWTLSYLDLGSSSSCRRLSNVVGGGCLSCWWQAEKGWKGLAAGSRVSTQASRDSTPFLSGGRGRMASGPPTHVWVPSPPILSVSPPFFLRFSCHVTNKTTILNRIRPKAYCLEWRAIDEKDGWAVTGGSATILRGSPAIEAPLVCSWFGFTPLPPPQSCLPQMNLAPLDLGK